MGDKSADKYLPGDTFPSQLTGWLLAANESLTCFSSLSLILGMGEEGMSQSMMESFDQSAN